MALVLRSVLSFYDYIFVTLKDPRTANFSLIGDSPLPVISIVVLYTLLCKYGPPYMKSRKPVELKFLMTLYNFIQVLFNTTASIIVRYSVNYLQSKFYSKPFDRRFITCCGSMIIIISANLLIIATQNMEWQRRFWFIYILLTKLSTLLIQ